MVFLGTFSSAVVNVDGNIFGKSFRATGRSASAKGTITKNEKGTSLPMSAIVVTNNLYSRRDSLLPGTGSKIFLFVYLTTSY